MLIKIVLFSKFTTNLEFFVNILNNHQQIQAQSEGKKIEVTQTGSIPSEVFRAAWKKLRPMLRLTNQNIGS